MFYKIMLESTASLPSPSMTFHVITSLGEDPEALTNTDTDDDAGVPGVGEADCTIDALIVWSC